MLNSLVSKITDYDQYQFNPESALVFNKKRQFPTFPGGCYSLTLTVLMCLLWYQQLYGMYFFLQNDTSINSTLADFKAIGDVHMDDIDSYPVYAIKYKGENVPPRSTTMCGETDGDCMKFVN